MPQPPNTDPRKTTWADAWAAARNPPASSGFEAQNPLKPAQTRYTPESGGFAAAWEAAREPSVAPAHPQPQPQKGWTPQPFEPPRSGYGPTGRVEPAAPDAPPSVEENWEPDQPHVPGTSPAERTKSAATRSVDAAQMATGTTIGSQAAMQAGTLGRTAAVAKGAWDASWEEAKTNLASLAGIPRGAPAPASEDDQGLAIIAPHAGKVEGIVGGLAGMAPSFADPKVIAAMVAAKAPTSAITNSPLARAAMGAVGRRLGPRAQAATTTMLGHATGGTTFGVAHGTLAGHTIGETVEEAAFTGALGVASALPGIARQLHKTRPGPAREGYRALADAKEAGERGRAQGVFEPGRGGAGIEQAAATMDEASFHEFTTRILADQTLPMRDRLAMTDELVAARRGIQVEAKSTQDIVEEGQQPNTTIAGAATVERVGSPRPTTAEEAPPAQPSAREAFRAGAASAFGPEHADATMPIVDAYARTWAGADPTRNPDDFYRRYEFKKGGEAEEGALLQAKPDASGFYSQAEKAVSEFKDPKGKMTGAQWHNWLKNQPGVKPEELEQLGIKDLPDKMTREQAAEWIGAHRVELEETVKGGKERYANSEDGMIELATDASMDHKLLAELLGPKRAEKLADKFGDVDAEELATHLIEEYPDDLTHFLTNKQHADLNTATQFSDYQTPGGEPGSYRELLLRMPRKTASPKAKLQEEYNTIIRDIGGRASTDPELPALVRRRDAISEQMGNLPGHQPIGRVDIEGEFRGGHFDEPNVLAHIRFNDRTGPDGKKILFIEEIQSDWHQKGRKQGYKGAKVDENAAHADRDRFYQGKGDMPDAEWNALAQRVRAHDAADKGVPDAPFKTTWQTLALKRAMKYAADHGYDRIAWTTGDMQNERYDLSKQVDEVAVVRQGNGEYTIRASKGDADLVNKHNLPPQELADHIGKELAERAIKELADQPTDAYAVYSGLDLKLGGEGMRGFYDKILPAEANRIAKKWGGKVEQGPLKYHDPDIEQPPFAEWAKERGLTPEHIKKAFNNPASTYWREYIESTQGPASKPVHTLELTPAAREHLVQGQPLFQKGEGKAAASYKLQQSGQRVIRALTDPDASSLPHEVWHSFLDTLGEIDPKLEREAREALGGKADGPITNAMHERWARAGETYLRTGEAPSPALARAFAKFKEWLTAIYRSIAGTPLEDQLNPRIREIFDEMLTRGDRRPQERTDAVPDSQRGHTDRVDGGPEAQGQARQTVQGPALQERPEAEAHAGPRPAQPGPGGSGAVREGRDGELQEGVLRPTVPHADPRIPERQAPPAEQRGPAPEPVAGGVRGPGTPERPAAAADQAPGPTEAGLTRKPRAGEYSRGDIERRLIEAHRATGLAPDSELSAAEADAAGHDALSTRFRDELPTEVREWVEENPSRRALFTVVKPGEPGYATAAGASVMAGLEHQSPGEYFRRLEARDGGKLEAAKSFAHGMEQMDPATKLLAIIHDSTPERKADQTPKAVIDQPERIPQGSTLTINGERYTVGTSDGEPVLIGDRVTTYLRALESLPYDKGSLKGAGETKAPSGATNPPPGETGGPPSATKPPQSETGPEHAAGATSARKAWTDIDREIMGNDPLEAPARRGWQQDLDDARAKGLHEPDAAMRSATAIIQSPRALSSTETAGMVHHLAKLKLEHDRLHKAVQDANPADTLIAGEEILRIEQEHDLLTEALRLSGTEKGRALASQKLTLDQDFSLITVLNRAKAATGDGTLPPETRARLETLTKQLEERTRQVDELQARIAKEATASADAAGKRLTETLDATHQELVKRSGELEASLAAARERAAKAQAAEHHERTLREAAEKAVPKYIRDLAAKFSQRLDQAAEAAEARLKARGVRLHAGIDPVELADYAIIGAKLVKDGAVKLAEWTTAAIAKFGEEARPHIDQLYAASYKRYEEELSRESRTVRKAVRKARPKAPAAAGAKPAGPSTLQKLQARAYDGTPAGDLRAYFQKLALEIVRSGTTEREAVLDALHAQVAPIFKGITREQTRDTLSGYGQWRELDKEAAKARLREISAESQKLAQLEALQRKEAPKATGFERQPPGDQTRLLTKQVNDAKKALGLDQPAGPARLKTLLQSAKTRIQNQIRDLQTEIDTGTRMVRNVATRLSSPELDALRTQLEAVRKAHEAAFSPPGLSDAQRLQLATNAAQRAAEVWEKRAADAKAGTFWSKTLPRRMSSPEVEALRARADAARAAFDELRALDPAQKASDDAKTNAAYRARLTERKAALLERLAKADFGPRPKKPGPTLDAASLAQKADVEATEQQFNAAKAIERLKAQIATLQGHQAAGTLPAGPKPRKPSDPAVAAMRATVQQIKSALNKSDPALRARFEAQIRAMEARLAAGVTAPAKKPETALTKELAKLAYQRDQLKRKINSEIRELKPKTIWQKIGAPINLSRSLVTSMDLSGTLRQGGFINIGSAASPGNAKRMAASLKAQGLSLISDQNAHEIQNGILNREDAPLWDRARLYLAPLDGTLGKREEATMSKLADRIPLVGGSQRAYVVGLNKLRADTATAMGKWAARNGTPTLAEARVIANFVNAATGRGQLPLGLEQASVLLNSVFFSPRYLASRIQIAIGQPLWGAGPYKGTGRARLAVAREYAKALAGLAVVYSAAQMAGLSVSFDPRSSDFGKIIVGTTRIDPLMGFAQLITLGARTYTGQTKATDTGRITPADPGKLLSKTFRSKLAPFPGVVWDLTVGQGKQYDGSPMTIGGTLAGLTLPLSYGDIFKALKEEGLPTGAALGILNLLGMSLQTHEVEELEKQVRALKTPKERLDAINAAIKDLPPKEQERVRRRLIQQHRVLVAPTKAR